MSSVSQTLSEEIANSVTHGVGAALSVAALTLLVTLATFHGDVWHLVSVSVYGTSLVLLYFASTLYHGLQHPKLKQIFQMLDHAAIYLLIAGTYTPFLLVNMRGVWGWSLFVVIWAMAIGGILFHLRCGERFPKVSLGGYLVMGWLCVIALPEMVETVGEDGMLLVFLGGVSYTVGVIFYVWQRLPYNHAIWHLFVLGGSIAHFFAVLWHVLPTPAVPNA
jgi:hemolysin III